MLLERNERLGGIARSGAIAHTGTRGRADLPTEISWRVIGADYVVCDDIFRDIALAAEALPGPGGDTPTPTNITRHKTVADNWTPVTDPYWILAGANNNVAGTSVRVSSQLSSLWRYLSAFRSQLTFAEQWHLLDCLLYGLSCSRARRSRELSRQTWADFLRPVPPAADPFLVRFVAPVFGVDMNRASASCVLEYVEHWWTPADNYSGKTRVSKMPTSDAWFEPWRRQLVERGVDVRVNSHVTRLVTDATNKTIAYVECVLDGVPCEVEADYYVCALPIEVVARLLPLDYPERDRFTQLAHITRQDMVGVQLYWRQAVWFAMPRTGILLLDSPWQLIIQSQGVFWEPSVPTAGDRGMGARYGDGTVHDIWTITLCDAVRPGLLLGKRWRDCTRPEIFKEVWHQLTRSEALVNGCRGADGTPLNRLEVRLWHLWDTFQPGRNGTLSTFEPKASPNAGSLALRPPTQSFYDNMFFGAVWTQSSKEMLRMETAASNGAAAARCILECRRKHAPCSSDSLPSSCAPPALLPMQSLPPRAFPLVFGVVRVLDRLMLALGLPHPSAIFLGSSTLLLVTLLLLFVTCVCTGLQRLFA
jgi:hypothetical protein